MGNLYKSNKKRYFVGVILYDDETKKHIPFYIYKIENRNWCLWKTLEVLNAEKKERLIFTHNYAMETMEALKFNGYYAFMQLTII